MFDENLLKQACNEAELIRLKKLINEIDKQPDHIFSKEFKKKKSQILKKYSSYNTETGKIKARGLSSKTARIILIAAVIASLLVASAVAYAPFRKFIVSEFTQGTEIVFYSTNGKDYLNETYSYIPSGYTLKEREKSKHICSHVYQNENDDMIMIQTAPNETAITINTEDVGYEKVDINGSVGFFVERDNSFILTWSTSKYNHIINASNSGTSGINRDEIIKIAQSRTKK